MWKEWIYIYIYISTPSTFSIVSSAQTYTPIYTGSSKAPALTEVGKVPPSIDDARQAGETQRSVFDMTEEEIVALEERARKVGGTGESPFAYRSPFSSDSTQ